MIALGAIGVVVLALLGMPLFAVVLAVAMLCFAASDISLWAIPIEIFGLAYKPLLVALPLFTFAGYVMAEAKTSERLMNVTRSLVGWFFQAVWRSSDSSPVRCLLHSPEQQVSPSSHLERCCYPC